MFNFVCQHLKSLYNKRKLYIYCTIYSSTVYIVEHSILYFYQRPVHNLQYAHCSRKPCLCACGNYRKKHVSGIMQEILIWLGFHVCSLIHMTSVSCRTWRNIVFFKSHFQPCGGGLKGNHFQQTFSSSHIILKYLTFFFQFRIPGHAGYDKISLEEFLPTFNCKLMYF